MTNKIESALGLSPIEYIDNDTGEIVTTNQSTEVTQLEDVVDEDFEEAARDAEMVRTNIKKLIERGFDMFEDVAAVATSTQNPDQYQASARFFSELIKANKELMNIHRDVFALKPALPKGVETQNNTQTNVFVATTSEDLIRMLREKGVGKITKPE